MPLYIETCDRCGDTTEKLAKMSDPPEPTPCTKCEGGTVTRQFGTTLLKFAGTGFYATDYQGKG